MFKFRSSKMFVAVLMVLVLATTAFAFAAANTMPADTFAGEGTTTTSGYTVSNVQYALTGSNIDNVSFDLDAAAGIVTVSLDGTDFYGCTNIGLTWTCTTTGETVAGATELTVIAAQ